MGRNILDVLEGQDCTRCGGSGHYSFNQIDGTRCYGCNGTGRQFTKRGAAAKKFYDSLRTKTAAEIVVGDLVYEVAYRKFHKVTEVRRHTWEQDRGTPGFDYEANERLVIQTTGVNYLNLPLDTEFIIGLSAEQKAENIEKTLAYQATLTKAGTIRKRMAA